MKIFGINILTDNQLDELQDEYIKEAFNCCQYHFQQVGDISELERLKKDHWDKDAFDRIIDALIGDKNARTNNLHRI